MITTSSREIKWARVVSLCITHSQVVTLKYGPKAYQEHLIPLCRAALIRGQPFEETSFMVGKYITKLPWPNVFPYY